MGHGNQVNHGTWELSKIMRHGNDVNHVTWEGGKSLVMARRYIMGHGMKYIMGHGNELNHGTRE